MEERMNKTLIKQRYKASSSINRVILKLTTGFTTDNLKRYEAKTLLRKNITIYQIEGYKSQTDLKVIIQRKITGFKNQVLELLKKSKNKVSNKSLLISELEDSVSIKKPIAGSIRHTGHLDKLKSTE